MLTVQQVIQKSSNVGAREDRDAPDAQGDVGALLRASASARSRRSTSPASSPAGCARTRPGARSSRRRWPTATACRPRCSSSRTHTRPSPTTAGMEPVSMTRQERPGPGVRVFQPETAREMLQDAADGRGARRHRPEGATLGYSVGGKSGTAHKQEGRGYAANKYRSWFVGLAPIAQPRIVVRGDGRRAEQRPALRRRRRGARCSARSCRRRCRCWALRPTSTCRRRSR